MIELESNGREYMKWDVESSNALVNTPSVAFVARGSDLVSTTPWVSAEWDGPAVGNRRTVRLLVAGPDAPSAAPDGYRVGLGEYSTFVRFLEGNEIIIRPGTDKVAVR